jgi:hypothetical protein
LNLRRRGSNRHNSDYIGALGVDQLRKENTFRRLALVEYTYSKIISVLNNTLFFLSFYLARKDWYQLNMDLR